ncbi:MAG: MEDS domain-containing protein [Ilumatobacteraceae bacterium]
METAHGIVPRDHVVQFYEYDDELVASVATFLADGLRAGEAAIVVATPAHVEAFDTAITALGIDVDAARVAGTLISVDVDDALSRILIDGWSDPAAFKTEIAGLIRRAAASGHQVRIYGEMVAQLWDAGHVAEAIELEALWNELGRHLAFSLYCAFRAHSVTDEDHAESFRHVCYLHSAVVGDSGTGPKATLTAVVARAEDARSFACETRSSGRARRFVADRLMAWGRDAYVDDASIIVAELATNAVLHARSEFIVALSTHGDTVRVSVRDASSRLPAMQHPTPDSISGRGLVLVAAVAQRWGTELLPDGKVVWADLSGN